MWFTFISIVFIALTIATLTYGPLRKFVGADDNNRILSLMVTTMGLVFALPFFAYQINNIDVRIDNLQASLENIYNSYQKEVFKYSDIKNDFQQNGTDVKISFHLKNKPIPNSVQIWWGEENSVGSAQISPQFIDVEDNVVTVNYSNRDLGSLTNPATERGYMIIYVSRTPAAASI